jgi:hypothetical protein
MRRFICLVGAIGLSASSIVSCSDDDLIVGPGRAGTGGSGGAAGRGGRSGSGGSGGSSIAGSNAGGSGAVAGAAGVAGASGSSGDMAGDDAGSDAGADEPDAGGPVRVDAGDAGPLISCTETPDCDDENLCTTEVCQDQVCIFTAVAIGTACGDTSTENECNQPDTCDDSGVCLTNSEPDGTLCEEGHCNTQGVCDCAVDRVTAVPYNQQWQTTGDTEADFYQECQTCAGTLDHVVVFTAPQTASYRFIVTSDGDPELGVFDGDCSAALADATCGADIDPGNEDYADVLDLEIEAGATVTLVVGESCEENGGIGTLSVDLTPDDG